MAIEQRAVRTGRSAARPRTVVQRAASPENLRLAGAAATLKMDAHVGHTISATGTLAKRDPIVTPGIVLPDPQPQGDTTSRTRDAEEAKTKAAGGPRTLNMTSMSHVAPECK